MSRLIRFPTAVAIALVLAGCASSSGARPADTARRVLREDVLALSRAAAARDSGAAATALDNLDADLAAIRTSSQLSPTQVAQIRAAADAVRADLRTLTTPTASPTASPSASKTPKPAKTKHPGKGNRNGNGNGDGNGD